MDVTIWGRWEAAGAAILLDEGSDNYTLFHFSLKHLRIFVYCLNWEIVRKYITHIGVMYFFNNALEMFITIEI